MTEDFDDGVIRTAKGEPRECRQCGGWYGTLGRLITRNGHTQLRYVCDHCSTLQLQNIPHATVDDLAAIPIVKDHSHRGAFNEGHCERCQQFADLDLHHWAPRSLFQDADDWPVALLCLDCHREWHHVTGVALGNPSLA